MFFTRLACKVVNRSCLVFLLQVGTRQKFLQLFLSRLDVQAWNCTDFWTHFVLNETTVPMMGELKEKHFNSTPLVVADVAGAKFVFFFCFYCLNTMSTPLVNITFFSFFANLHSKQSANWPSTGKSPKDQTVAYDNGQFRKWLEVAEILWPQLRLWALPWYAAS